MGFQTFKVAAAGACVFAFQDVLILFYDCRRVMCGLSRGPRHHLSVRWGEFVDWFDRTYIAYFESSHAFVVGATLSDCEWLDQLVTMAPIAHGFVMYFG